MKPKSRSVVAPLALGLPALDASTAGLGLGTFQLAAPPRVQTFEETHGPAMARGARCDVCPLAMTGGGPVLGEIRPGSVLTIVGEGPGENELREKRPFVGWSGKILDAALAEGGVVRSACSVTNTALCKAPDDDGYKAFCDALIARWKRQVKIALRRAQPPPDPPVMPHQACAPRLARDIAEANSRTILAVGKFALEACARELGVPQGAARVAPGEPYAASIAKQHGAPIVLRDGRILMSSYHPAMAARAKKEYLPVIRENLTRAAWLARTGVIPWVEPPFIFDPTKERALEFLAELRERMAPTAIDIETDSVDVYTTRIRCIGFATKFPGEDERVLVLPFRHMDGTRWWSDEDGVELALAVRETVDLIPLIAQNGAFDTSVLLERGFMTNREKTFNDTMLYHHDTPDNDLPHDLGFIARRFFCMPMWKADADHKSTSNVDDPVLHLYNGRDALVTYRLIEPLAAQVKAWETEPQLETDTALAPIVRDMSRMGLIVDEAQRGEFSEMLSWHCQRELYKFRELIEQPKFNPRSVPQLQELIFGTWGYYPVLGMDGYEIERDPGDWQRQMLSEADADDADANEYEVGSTSSASIIELTKKRELEPVHLAALMTLLEYRAYDKLRGTYVDNPKVRAVDWAQHGYDIGRQPAVTSLVWDPKADDYVWRELISERSNLSLLNSTFKNSVTPTGRLASSGPNFQNIPAIGKLNLRRMFVAAPGHVLVGADYAQVEARIYAVVAQDALLLQAIREGRDIHSMNAATLWAKNLSEVDYWYRKIELGEGIEPSKRKIYRKYARTAAKRFCVAEGELVLTNVGLVPIEQVQRYHRVWDGVEWVTHDGVVYQGEKEIIEYDGLKATPDHKVWLEDGRKVEFGEAAHLRVPLARTGSGRNPFRFMGGRKRCMARRRSPKGDRTLYRLRSHAPKLLRQPPCRQVERLPLLYKNTPKNAAMVAVSNVGSQRSLHQQYGSALEALWRPRNRISVRVNQRSCAMDDRPLWSSRPEPASRSDRQQRTLRTWKSPVGYSTRKQHEQTQYQVARDLAFPAERMAFLEKGRREVSQTRSYTRRDYPEGTRLRKGQTQLVDGGRRTIRVYDILNAGPRRRFTVSGKLVSNCFLEIYGGSPDKLFSVMAAQRNKETGELDFADLKPSDVAVWHDNWHKLHPETKQWHERCQAFCEATGYSQVAALDYRRRYFLGGASRENAVPNIQIQGFAASLMNSALRKLVAQIPFRSWSYWTGVNLQVHDFLCAQVPTARGPETAKILEDCMLSTYNDVKFPAEAAIATRWSKLD